MDDVRDSFSRLKKDIKRRLKRSKGKGDRTDAGGDGERVDSPGPLPQSEPAVVTGGGHKGDRTEIGEDGERVDPSGPLPRPEPVVVTGGGREGEGNGSNPDDRSVGPGAAADKNKSDWKSIASASAKLLLYGVRDSADAFAPLKSVAGGLCFILENCEVWPSPACTTYDAYRCPSKRKRISKR